MKHQWQAWVCAGLQKKPAQLASQRETSLPGQPGEVYNQHWRLTYLVSCGCKNKPGSPSWIGTIPA